MSRNGFPRAKVEDFFKKDSEVIDDFETFNIDELGWIKVCISCTIKFVDRLANGEIIEAERQWAFKIVVMFNFRNIAQDKLRRTFLELIIDLDGNFIRGRLNVLIFVAMLIDDILSEDTMIEANFIFDMHRSGCISGHERHIIIDESKPIETGRIIFERRIDIGKDDREIENFFVHRRNKRKAAQRACRLKERNISYYQTQYYLLSSPPPTLTVV